MFQTDCILDYELSHNFEVFGLLLKKGEVMVNTLTNRKIFPSTFRPLNWYQFAGSTSGVLRWLEKWLSKLKDFFFQVAHDAIVRALRERVDQANFCPFIFTEIHFEGIANALSRCNLNLTMGER